MLEDIKAHITRLIALYEGEKQRADALEARLQQSEERAGEYKTQVYELNSQIDNLKLSGAFTSAGDSAASKERLDKLVRNIDRCIKLLEK